MALCGNRNSVGIHNSFRRIRSIRRRWWLYASLAAAPFLGILVLVSPVRTAPHFDKPKPGRRQALEDLFAAAATAWAAKDYAAVRADCEQVLVTPAAPVHFQSYARLRIAQSYRAETNPAAAKLEYEKITANAAYPEVHRFEAEECVKEIDRVVKGLPPRDVTASRIKVPPVGAFAAQYFGGSARCGCESRHAGTAVCHLGTGPRCNPRPEDPGPAARPRWGAPAAGRVSRRKDLRTHRR